MPICTHVTLFDHSAQLGTICASDSQAAKPPSQLLQRSSNVAVMSSFYWSIIYGKVVFNTSLVKAVSRGLLPSLRAARVVSPSFQNISLVARLENSFAPTSPLFSPSPKMKSWSLNVTADRGALSEGLADAHDSGLEVSILSFVEQVAAWTEDEKERQIQLLNKADAIVMRERLAHEMKLTDFDVQDDGDERWKACEAKILDSHDTMFEKVEDATGDFEVMISQLSMALQGAISENICYKSEYLALASILTIDPKMVSGWTEPSSEDNTGVSAFKVRPGFFGVSAHDERSLKFASNLLGLDGSANTRDLQDFNQPSPQGYYGAKSSKASTVDMLQMGGNEPAWYTVQNIVEQ
jgi:hypothetical protein